MGLIFGMGLHGTDGYKCITRKMAWTEQNIACSLKIEESNDRGLQKSI